jgi:uncharacterized cupin superfamily protein
VTQNGDSITPFSTVPVRLPTILASVIEANQKGPMEKKHSSEPPESASEAVPETGPRPAFVAHWRDMMDEHNWTYEGSDEALSIGSSLGRKMGLERLGIHHKILPPGRRTSWPHAESAEEEFVYVLEGQPDAWINGHLHRLQPGDAVAFPAGTGIAHTFINNTEVDVRLLVVGETSKAENKVHYPLHPHLAQARKDWWTDCPVQEMGPHDGLPDLTSSRESLR